MRGEVTPHEAAWAEPLSPEQLAEAYLTAVSHAEPGEMAAVSARYPRYAVEAACGEEETIIALYDTAAEALEGARLASLDRSYRVYAIDRHAEGRAAYLGRYEDGEVAS